MREGVYERGEDGLNIKVTDPHVEEFFEHCRENSESFKTHKYHPNCKPGDLIKFYNGGRLIATTKVDRVINPGEAEGELKLHYNERWIIYWKRETFQIKQQGETASSR